jgi:hypothetical protein
MNTLPWFVATPLSVILGGFLTKVIAGKGSRDKLNDAGPSQGDLDRALWMAFIWEHVARQMLSGQPAMEGSPLAAWGHSINPPELNAEFRFGFGSGGGTEIRLVFNGHEITYYCATDRAWRFVNAVRSYHEWPSEQRSAQRWEISTSELGEKLNV